MSKRSFFLFLLMLTVLFLQTMPANALLLLDENFQYSTGQLTDNGSGANVSGGNWVDFSGTAAYIQVVSGSLSYPDYLSSGTGNKIEIISPTTSAEDAYRQFAIQGSGTTTYCSFLLNLENTNSLADNSSTTGDYFAALLPSTSTTIYVGRITIKLGTVANTYNLGIRATSTNSEAAWASTNLSPGTTYLVVMAYRLNSDYCWLWVNPSLSGAQPTADAEQAAATSTSDIARIAIRQGYVTIGVVSTPNASIDGFRVGNNWADIPGLNPQVASVFPHDNAANIRPNAKITVQFNRLMKASTIDTTSFTVKGIRQATYLADSIVPASDSDFFTYYIADSLLMNDTVTVTLKASITDTGNIPLSDDYVWNFYTLAPETIKPYLAASTPANNSSNVKVTNPITINFSEQIDTMTVDSATVSVLGRRISRYQADSVKFGDDGASVIFYPKDSLSYRDTVTVMVRAPLADYSGNLIADTSFYFSTKLSPSVPISEIQYPGGNSPLLNSIVTIEGIVTSPLLDKMSTDITFCVQDDTTAWSGIWVWDPGKAVNRGDRVRLTGTVSELFNRTTITSVNSYTVLATDQPLPPPISVTTSTVGTAGTAEAYEGVLVKVSNMVVTAIPNSYGEWTASDGSGNCKFDDASGYSYEAALGDSLRSVIGVLDYNFSEFKIQPRDDDDIIDNFAPYVKKYIPTDTLLYIYTNKPLNSATLSDSTVTIVGHIGGTRQFTYINDTTLCLLRIRPNPALAMAETLHLTLKASIQDLYGATLDGNANRVSQGSPTDDYLSTDVIDTRSLSVAEVQRPGANGFNSAYEGQMVAVLGTLTGPDYIFTSSTASTASWYLQDATGGVNIYGGKKGSYQSLGRNYLVKGRVTEYNGVTEIAADTMIVKLDALNNLSPPRALVYNQILGESIEGLLASVEGTISSVPSYAGGGYNMELRNGNAPIAVRFGDDDGFDRSQLTFGQKVRVSGIVSQYDTEAPYTSGYQLVPRFPDPHLFNGILYSPDIELLSDTTSASASAEIVSIKPNPFSLDLGEVGIIEINAPSDNHLTLRIYDLKGRLVKTCLNNVPGGHQYYYWDGTDDSSRRANIGMYIAHLRSVTAEGAISNKTKIIVLGTPLK